MSPLLRVTNSTHWPMDDGTRKSSSATNAAYGVVVRSVRRLTASASGTPGQCSCPTESLAPRLRICVAT